MTFVTRLRFTSGDREALDDTVSSLKKLLERKGVECKGPHADPPEHMSVPMAATLGPGTTIDQWKYTVYGRRLEIHGAETTAREVTEMSFPDAVHLEVEVDRKRPVGSTDS